MKKAILYIHGKGGSYLEAEAYKKNCVGFDIIGVDYKDYFPWSVEKQIKTAYDKVHKKYKHICLLANSIGAYFAMYALQNCQLEKALFISPVLDTLFIKRACGYIKSVWLYIRGYPTRINLSPRRCATRSDGGSITSRDLRNPSGWEQRGRTNRHDYDISDLAHSRACFA